MVLVVVTELDFSVFFLIFISNSGFVLNLFVFSFEIMLVFSKLSEISLSVFNGWLLAVTFISIVGCSSDTLRLIFSLLFKFDELLKELSLEPLVLYC